MKISGGAILCARSWSTYFEAACSAGMAKLLPKKWHDFHSTIENLEMSIGRIEKDLLTFLLTIWVKVLHFMIYPFERQLNAEIPSSFYQGHFSLLSAISVKRGKNICYPEVLMFQECGEAEAAIWEYFTAVPFYLILFTSNPSFSPCITHNVTIKIVPINTITQNIFKISTCR